MSRVLIVDDHPMIRFAARLLLERAGYAVAGEADNGVEALSLARELRPELVLLDIGIPKLDGLEVIQRLQSLQPAPRILVLTSMSPAIYASRCMLAGASGFVAKGNNLSELAEAAKAVLAGNKYFPDATLLSVRLSDGVFDDSVMLQSLSDREVAVLKYLASGLSNKEIGDEMLISNKTVSTYKTRLMLKLKARTLVDLLEFAKRNAQSL
ncbi:response regulator transcription factor [Pseudomonas sp. UL073]|uniref:Response regulator transcription factor n=1 Tax=Zestomonas insulae TaxID=2809017 RepID=A0ABS2IEK6_9GAMM|nr:response regulator transcription factor [Pseudomonas insulae]MBM7060273.1 response regulator transcription factor [Pseudomonas insulae]